MNHDLLKDATGKILQLLNLPHSEIIVRMDGDVTRIDIASNDASRIIGWHGETLNSIQHILKSIIRTAEHLDKTPLLVVDADGYRAMQEEKVRKIADAKADFVRRTGSRVALSPMSPYFRRIVHVHIANTPALQDLTTESVGEGDYRQIVLRLKVEHQRAAQSTANSEELTPIIAPNDGLENLDI